MTRPPRREYLLQLFRNCDMSATCGAGSVRSPPIAALTAVTMCAISSSEPSRISRG
ncbi:hypothetical protein ACFFKH_20110 [Micromonospora marina]|uniref:Uncharacterized protein n=1 Tax=Micromonospora marina TaxID=307120 RepID=A0A1C4X3U0_9ACTN|nr:hypothetical protein [Micromonospora marina]SCF03128.1 hypothetical protein GA0070215_106120 [Micromonospora marina]